MQQKIIKNCCVSILQDIGKKARAEQAAYQKRGYGRNGKIKPIDLLHLRLAELKQEMRERLRRLRLEPKFFLKVFSKNLWADDWIEEFIARNFKVMRKNSKGHAGISKRR